MRLRLRVLLLVPLLLALVVPVALPAAAAPAPPSGPTEAVAYQIGVGHDGYSADTTLATPLNRRWSRDLGGSVSYPLIAQDKVFVTAVTPDSTENGTVLYALDRATGATVWSQPIPGTYYWSGATYEAGRVFVVNSDGVLRSFDAATGAPGWSSQLPGQYAFSSPPTAAGGVVYVVGAGMSGTLYAVRGSDGALLWSQFLAASGNNSSPALSGTSVFVSFACGIAFGFDRVTGQPLWTNSGTCVGGGGRTPVYHDGRVYTRAYDDNEVIDAGTGSTVGTFQADVAPAFAGRTGLFLSNGVLQAVRGRRTLWSFTGDGSLVTAPIVVGGRVFVGSSTGMLYGLALRSGRLAWSTDVGTGIQGPDEHNVSQPLTGLSAGQGVLVVPADTQVVAYGR